MIYVKTRLKNFWFLFTKLQFSEIYQKIRFRIYSDSHSLGFVRDLTGELVAPCAKIPVRLRGLAEKDIPKIFNFANPKLTSQDKADLIARLEHLHSGIPLCCVAVTSGDTPVYMQWLMTHEVNEQVQSYFNGIFPWLDTDTVLAENALTLVDYRGLGVMADAMGQIVMLGKSIGAKRMLTFVDEKNVPSRKAVEKLGFTPYTIRHEKWVLFRRQMTFTEIAEQEREFTEIPLEVGESAERNLSKSIPAITAVQ